MSTTTSQTFTAGYSVCLSVDCPTNTSALGGGRKAANANLFVQSSYPKQSPSGWTACFAPRATTTGSVVYVYAICATVN